MIIIILFAKALLTCSPTFFHHHHRHHHHQHHHPHPLCQSIAHLLPKSVVMSNGAGPSKLRIVIPTVAKMVKKTNLQMWIRHSVFWEEKENKKKKISPHDHDLLECSACYKVPQSIQGGGGHNLRYLHHHFYLTQVLSISYLLSYLNSESSFLCATPFYLSNKSHRLKDTKEECGGDYHFYVHYPEKVSPIQIHQRGVWWWSPWREVPRLELALLALMWSILPGT